MARPSRLPTWSTSACAWLAAAANRRARRACATAAWWKTRARKSRPQVKRGWLAERRAPLPVFPRAAIARALTAAGTLAYLYEASGAKALLRAAARFKLLGRLGDLAQLAPSAEPPFFFSEIGRTFPAHGARRYRVAFLAGCVANVLFARLNEATVRVLQRNGCEVVIPAGQGCCGALHVHGGLREEARKLARRNIDAVRSGEFHAIMTNAAGCGSTLKEYGELLAEDPVYAAKAADFAARMMDVTEFLAALDLNRDMGPVDATVTYQDSCHLAHGQRIRTAPRQLLARGARPDVPGDAGFRRLLRQRRRL